MPAQMRLNLPVGTDPASVRQRVEAMERILERLFAIPGTKQSVGLDVVLDLVPIVGDIAAAALGAYIVWEAKNLGMSKGQIARMAGNVGFDWLLGLIPCGRRDPGLLLPLQLAQPAGSSSAISTSITRKRRSSRDRPARVSSRRSPTQTCTPSISSSTGRPADRSPGG